MRARPLICKLGNAFLRGLLQGQNSQLTSLSVNRHRKLLAQGLTQRWLNNCKTGDFPGGSRREGSPREDLLHRRVHAGPQPGKPRHLDLLVGAHRLGPLPSRPPPLKDGADDQPRSSAVTTTAVTGTEGSQGSTGKGHAKLARGGGGGSKTPDAGGWTRRRAGSEADQAPRESCASRLCDVDWTRGLTSGGDYRALRKEQEVCLRRGRAHRRTLSLPSAQAPASCLLFPRGRCRQSPQTAAAFGFAETTYIA